MYNWRKMTNQQREEVLQLRKRHQVPWHSPAHPEEPGLWFYHLTGSCYEHSSIIGESVERMALFEKELLGVLEKAAAWCVMPNHWHALVRISNLKQKVAEIGQLNGRTSFLWNKEDNQRGRKCWHRCSDRRVRSDDHRFAVMNYIHHNPVKHGYVSRWDEWPFSSATRFLKQEGRERAEEIWKNYPTRSMGRGWDD